MRYGDELSQAAVEKKIPRKVKKRRKVQTDDGVCFEINPLYLNSSLLKSFSYLCSHDAVDASLIHKLSLAAWP